MIDGFEQYTEDVKAEDLPTIKMLAKGLNARIGVDNAITNKDIRESFLEKKNLKIGDPKLRKFIQFIRAKRYVNNLCASSKGYYRAETKEEWLEYREGYRGRVKSMQFTLACMDKEQFV
jgi:hypothetical protein